MAELTNRLAGEKSPYLLQHAHNPVDWYPWGAEAFAKARTESKPIFLSIGYSTCHWCHVMERESFENTDVARFLNAHYVAIKVDREERPDVDAVYMSALQAMTGSGGWPMSVFLAPDLKPFYAGTYFPPRPAHGRPSFLELLERIHELWLTNREFLLESADHITDSLKEIVHGAPGGVLTRDLFDKTYQYFESAYDRNEGGFGGAPKFPRPVQFDFLLNYGQTFAAPHATEMVLHTLRKMAQGGMHDHLGGGFHRYSVDRYWRVSHFEKMLYDQAQLLNSYLDAWQLTHDDIFRIAAEGIAQYVLRDLRSPEGGFHSAEDADSEGEEGKFYAWTLGEAKELLGADAEPFAFYFGLTEVGNFEHGRNVLHITHSVEESAQRFNKSQPELGDLLQRSKDKLFEVRSHRVRPLLDDKVLTSWNGLMLGAMARAGSIWSNQKYIDAAVSAGEFVWHNLHSDNGLLHRWREGEAKFDAYLDDYAFLIDGYIDLYEATFDERWIERALKLQMEHDRVLWDDEHGGYFSSRASADLILRSKGDYDGAEPSGNSVALRNLHRLAILTEDSIYRERADKLLAYFLGRVAKYPFAMPGLMAAAFWGFTNPTQIVLAGEDLRPLQQIISERYLPTAIRMSASSATGPFASSLEAKEGKPTAYVCHNFTCELPVTSPEALAALLAKG